MALTQLSPTAIPGGRYQFWPKSKGQGPFTELSVTALPGQRHSFSAKSASLKGTGPFTELSVIAVPGQRHSFVAKTPAVVSGKGDGPFTWLTPYALPGKRYVLVPKTEAVQQVARSAFVGRGGGWVRPPYEEPEARPDWRLRDDKDLLELIQIIVGSGILG